MHLPIYLKLPVIRDKGVMSPRLKKAIVALIKAVETKDIRLAYNLSMVKSFMTSTLFPLSKTYAFQEDHDANVKILGSSIYSILDTIHDHLAYMINELPSGMVLAGKAPATKYKKPFEKHPILKRILKERKDIELKYKTK